jgi:oxygen-independent coproporphyrinogen III oxidase
MLIDLVNNLFAVSKEAEITLEANPDDLKPARLLAFRNAGINRLSIGIQSFDDRILKFLNRAHDAQAAIQCVPFAREAGFNNVSLDLIYAIPGQDENDWRRTIQKAIALDPEHLSAYSLTIEKKTAFGQWAATGRLKTSDDDISAEHLDILINELEQAGYEHYEVSNFSKPGYHSQHNSSYWKRQKYLGIGPSAHSYNLVTRQFNIRNNHQYVRSLREGKIPFELEMLSAEDHVNEYLLTTLRTQWGSDLQKLKQEFNYDIQTIHQQLINRLLDSGLAIIECDHLKLTRKGKFLADKISVDLFLAS